LPYALDTMAAPLIQTIYGASFNVLTDTATRTGAADLESMQRFFMGYVVHLFALITVGHIVSYALSSTYRSMPNAFTPAIPKGEKRMPTSKPMWLSYICSLFHAQLVAWSAFVNFYQRPADLHATADVLTWTNLRNYSGTAMIAYLVVDGVLLCLMDGTRWFKGEKNQFMMYSAHHVLGFFSEGLAIYSGVGSLFFQWVHLCEFSTFFMHIRFFLLELGYKGTKLATANDLCFAIFFFVIRVLCIPVITYRLATSKDAWPSAAAWAFQLLVTLFFNGINALWFQQILGAVGLTGKSKKSKSK